MSDKPKKEYKVFKNGQYPAKLAYWSCEYNDNGKLFVNVKFNVGESNDACFGRWYFIEGKCMEITTKALYTMGFRGKSAADLTKPNALDKNADITVTIENEVYNNRTISKVAWVNKPFKKEYDAGDVKRMGGVDMRAYMAEVAKDNPSHTQEAKEQGTSVATDATFTADDIPF